MASATSNLCDSANAVVQGEAQEEKLIAAAKAVASSTAQLLLACQVKADAKSENNKRLQVQYLCVNRYTCTQAGQHSPWCRGVVLRICFQVDPQ